MKCPRCATGVIPPNADECNVCGFMLVGGATLQESLAALDEATRSAVDGYARPLGVVRRTERSLVYFAEERETERGVLVKVLLPASADAPQVVMRFEQEMPNVMALAHPHVIAVRRFGTSRASCWYSMDQAPGQTVDELTYKTGTLDLPLTLQLANQVASALDYMHGRGFTHGNLKPSNIIVDPRGGVGVGDGGIRRVWGMMPPLRAGTAPEDALAYLAPEHFDLNGAVGPGADQYALAAILFEALVGVPPFRGVSFEDFAEAHRHTPPPDVLKFKPELPRMLGKALQRALSKDPRARFPTTVDFTKAMARPVGRKPSPTVNPALAVPTAHQQVLLVEPAAPPPPPARSPWRVFLLGGGAVAVVLAVFVIGITSRAESNVDVADNPPPPQDLVSEFSGEPAESVHDVAPSPAPVVSPAAAKAPPVTRAAPPPEPLPAPAHLSVNSTPWAVLSIDGTVVGNTPLIGLTLPPGFHRIQLSRDGFQPYNSTVQLSAGQDARVTGITLQVAR